MSEKSKQAGHSTNSEFEIAIMMVAIAMIIAVTLGGRMDLSFLF